MNRELLEYVRAQLAAGVGKEAIKRALLEKNWTEEKIEEAFQRAAGGEGNTGEPAGGGEEEGSSFAGPFSLFKKAVKVYLKNFFVYLGINLASILLVAFLVFLLIFVFRAQSVFRGSIENGDGFIARALLVVAVLLGASFLQFWSQAAIICATRDRDEKTGIVGAFRGAWGKVIPYFWVSSLLGLITGGGIMLLFVPGIIFAVWFGFAAFVLMVEDERGLNALIKSKRYVAGRWWGVFWREIVGFLIVGLLTAGSTLALYYSLGALWGETGRGVAGYMQIVLAPLAVIYFFLLYEELKELKGTFSFTSKKREKIIPLVCGLLGVLIVPGVFGAITLSSLGRARGRARDARIIAEMSQLRSVAETSYSFKKDEYEFSIDSERVAPLVWEIESRGGNIILKKERDKYCAYTNLPTGGYYCIDSFGEAVRVPEEPDATCNDNSFRCPQK